MMRRSSLRLYSPVTRFIKSSHLASSHRYVYRSYGTVSHDNKSHDSHTANSSAHSSSHAASESHSHGHDDHGYGHGHDDHGHHEVATYPPMPKIDKSKYYDYGFDLGESTPFERKDDKVYINPYNGRLERWIDVEELFGEEYWNDPYNWDAWDYIWKCKVEHLLNKVFKIPEDQHKEFRKNYEFSSGHATLEWINKTPVDVHTYAEPVAFGYFDPNAEDEH